ncbi:hypothetical protein [Bradyrhizobium sp. USDA 329]|uniref:hypothetical protein n=1 Tax=unclassified Bradyrhizobium TaxID=2631580 RepID=UPI0035189F76
MTDRPASWRFPTMKQIQKLASDLRIDQKRPPAPALGPADDLPVEYWQALLDDPRVEGGRIGPGPSGRLLRLSQIPQHILRVECRRCGRTVEIQKADATRLYGPDAIWKDVGQRLLDATCTQRTGRHEEDGCWPSYGSP